MVNESFAQPIAIAAGSASVERRTRLFLVASLSMIAIVLIGFGPTLYLRALFDPPPDALRAIVLTEGGAAVDTQLPASVYVHGVVMTAWFVLLAVQAWLVAAGRTGVHRRLGVAGAVLAVLVVGTGVDLSLSFPSRIAASGLENSANANLAIWLNLGGLFAFSVLVGAALYLRARSAIHKRLMLVASIGMIDPALGRISAWPVLAEMSRVVAVLVANLPLLALLAMLIVHDIKTRRRPHLATVLAILFAVVARPVALAIGNSTFGQAFTAGLYAP
jgi:hypothetical protein